MDNPLLVQIVHSLTDLLKNVAGLEFRMVVVIARGVFLQGRTVNHLGENVKLVWSFGDINEADDIFLVDSKTFCQARSYMAHFFYD